MVTVTIIGITEDSKSEGLCRPKLFDCYVYMKMEEGTHENALFLFCQNPAISFLPLLLPMHDEM